MNDEDDLCLSHGHGSWSGTWRNLLGDIDRHLTMTPESSTLEISFKRRVGSFLRPEIQSLFMYRLSHYLYIHRWRRLARAVSRLNFQLHKIRITPQSCIGPRCRLPHPPGVMLHGRAGTDLTVYSLAICTTNEDCLEGPVTNGPKLGNGVVLGAHCVLMGPIFVGDSSKIMFAVRLDDNVPAGVIATSRAALVSHTMRDVAIKCGRIETA